MSDTAYEHQEIGVLVARIGERGRQIDRLRRERDALAARECYRLGDGWRIRSLYTPKDPFPSFEAARDYLVAYVTGPGCVHERRAAGLEGS